MAGPLVSLIVITRNEEVDLPGCLDSVRGLADEIVVVDSGSTDRTREVARRYTERVVEHPFEGYARQKQHALDLARGTWVINLDADERLTPALREEIRAVTARTDAADGYRVPYHHYFLGRRLRFGGLGGETHVRLFRREHARYGTEAVHEGIAIAGRVDRLANAIEHRSYRNYEEYLEKCNRYTSLIARAKFARGERFAAWQHLRLPWEFAVRYVVKGGFLDGGAGFAYALLSSYYVWLKYAKLSDLAAGRLFPDGGAGTERSSP